MLRSAIDFQANEARPQQIVSFWQLKMESENMFEKSPVSERPAVAEQPKASFLFSKPKVDLDMGEGSRLQGFKLNGSR